ncbi:hypothetical protein CRYUN_Cryun10bG0069300 [Craigia yunnanensis]
MCQILLYCGTLGTAFLLFKSFQLTNNTNDLSLCLAIVDACNSASLSSPYTNHFLPLPNRYIISKGGWIRSEVFWVSLVYRAVVEEINKNGKAIAKKGGGSPWMFEWYGEKYGGAAHGLAGIMHVLMDMELKPDGIQDVKGTLRYMIRNRLPSEN